MTNPTNLRPRARTGSWLHLRAMVVGAAGYLAASGAFGAADVCPARGKHDPDCGQHNMMLVGGQHVFASHLPMFDSVHRFQVILAVDFAQGGADRMPAYTKDRAEHPGVGMYTLQPHTIFPVAQLFDANDRPVADPSPQPSSGAISSAAARL